MAKTLEKERKRIAKKKQGAIGALHEGSRDSRRLHKAQVRDDRLEKLAASRRKQEQPLIDRAKHFQELMRAKDNQPLSLEQVQDQIKAFVRKYSQELDTLKKERRPGRPPSTREDLLKMKVSTLENEHHGGFLIPDLTSQDNVALLDRWEGSWAYLSTLTWVRVSDSGAVRPSSFPPNKGQ